MISSLGKDKTMPKKATLALFYYLLAAIALLVTWFYNGQYLLNGGGLGPGEFFGAAFANSLTTAITLDVYLAAVAFSVWVASDARRLAIKRWWLYVVLCFGIGLAISLPLYLAAREKSLTNAGIKT